MENLKRRLRRLRRSILGADTRLREDYFANNPSPKLQIGGGWHRLDGWLNTDLQEIPGVMQMDAGRRFPFNDESFDLVYSEHMIEHVPLPVARAMVSECYRVLKKGGQIRLITPDLAAIIGVYNARAGLAGEYLNFFNEAFAAEGYPPNAVGMINAQFRLWGHQFLYDEAEFTALLDAVGFREIKRVALGVSDNPALCGMENESRYPPDLLKFESLALEAIKPG